ncbi:MAG TPA: hypothetical protein VIU62_15485 [Chloroflexota bacterium]
MPRLNQVATRGATTRRTRSRGTHQFRNGIVALQVEAALQTLQEAGVLTGQADKVSTRIDHGLLAAAARKVGSDNTTAVVQAALAAFVAPDPFVEWFLSDRDRLPADFERVI